MIRKKRLYIPQKKLEQLLKGIDISLFFYENENVFINIKMKKQY